MAQKNELSDSLDGVFKLMAEAYNGNWKFRWGSTPYFDTGKTGKVESVPAHEWDCTLLWLVLRRVCPELNKLVNPTEVYEILTTHDLGETYQGDVSRFQQLQGIGVDKGLTEREAIRLMTEPTTESTRTEILGWFDEFEKKPDQVTKLEFLVARFVDSLQGDHFALTFGHDLATHSESIGKIVNKHTVPWAKRLIEVLEKSGHVEASEEVKQVFRHHVAQIEKAGIKLDKEEYPA